MNRYENGREYLVTSRQARAIMAAERQAEPDTLVDVIAGLSVLAFLVGAGFLLVGIAS